MRLGARIFKTGLAITLALYAGLWLGYETPAYAALAAFFAVQPSVHKTFVLIGDQIQANLMSAFLAIIFVLAFGHEPFVIGVVVMLVIAILLKFNKESIIPLAVITAVIIMGTPTDNFIYLASNRFFLIMIGVFSAFIVNMIFLPPKHENLLYHKLVDSNEQVIQWIRLLTRNEAEYRTLRNDLNRLKEFMIKVENLFLLYQEERNYLRKNEYSRMRKVVLFRQMISASKKAMGILKSLTKNENLLHQMPDEIQNLIQEQLDYLTNYHERILLKYMGKVKANSTDGLYEEVGIGKRQLTELFLNYYDDKEIERNEWIHFFPVIALIIEYSEELERLDRLVNGFFKFHKADNEVDIQEKEH